MPPLGDLGGDEEFGEDDRRRKSLYTLHRLPNSCMKPASPNNPLTSPTISLIILIKGENIVRSIPIIKDKAPARYVAINMDMSITPCRMISSSIIVAEPEVEDEEELLEIQKLVKNYKSIE